MPENDEIQAQLDAAEAADEAAEAAIQAVLDDAEGK